IQFAFQGGEPSLAGLDFFKRFVRRVTEKQGEGQRITWAFQTNGVDLDSSWADFFNENEILVGISFDGNRRIHDLHRVDHQTKGSGRRVLETIETFAQKAVDFNTLSVVTSDIVDNVQNAYSFLIEHGLHYHQYIPCIDPIQGATSFLRSEEYERFLKVLFDLWFDSQMRGIPVSIRFFDNLVGMIAGYPPESCDMAGICSVQYVSESNGDIYPCDFYCTDEYRLGNILVDEFSVLDERRTAMRFIEESPNMIDECVTCPWKHLCRGGCKRYRSDSGYRFCSTMKGFFPYVIERLHYVAKQIIPT
ncbi:MAG: SPASM domain-containing protein, partial [Sphaerochaeta sp.]